MSRIAATFQRLRQENRKALIPFVMAGYPTRDITPRLMHDMVKAGADILELGVPFSDPSADGPIIQQSGEVALRNGINLSTIFDMVRTFRQNDAKTPVVLMGYANPIEAYEIKHGESAFAKAANAAGVDGVLVVDYTPQECTAFTDQLNKNDIDLIFLIAPTSTIERIQAVEKIASGYVYYVSLKGVTGSGALDVDAVREKLAILREHITLPIGVGFGIRDALSATRIGEKADAVIIGSRIIELLGNAFHDEACRSAGDFLRTIRLALDDATPLQGED